MFVCRFRWSLPVSCYLPTFGWAGLSINICVLVPSVPEPVEGVEGVEGIEGQIQFAPTICAQKNRNLNR